MTAHSLVILLFQFVPVSVLCRVLTVAFWSAYRLLRRQVRWSSTPISLRIFQFVVTHSQRLLQVNETEVDDFLEFPCFFYDPTDAGNLISASSAFSKPNFYIWKFSMQVLLKPGLKDFEYNLTSMWREHNCSLVWKIFSTAFFEIGIKTDFSWSCGHCWVFQICWHTECNTLTALVVYNTFSIISQWEFHQFY